MSLRLIAVLFFAGLAQAQTPPASPTFDVASIKPAAPLNPAAMASGKMHMGMKIDAARVDIGFMSLADLIKTAYDVKPYQIQGPDWIKTERYDVMAKMPEGSTKEQVPEMLKALLAERFLLKTHKESTQHPIYALVVGKGGSKLKDAPPDPVMPEDGSAPGKGGMTIDTGQGPMRVTPGATPGSATMVSKETGTIKTSMADGIMHMEASKVSMPKFAEMLNQFVDRPVVDQTELKGNYQVTLDLSMQELMAVARKAGLMNGAGPMPGGPAADTASDPAGGSVFTAVQQMGLKLEPKKDSLEMIVVDHVEKAPSAN